MDPFPRKAWSSADSAEVRPASAAAPFRHRSIRNPFATLTRFDVRTDTFRPNQTLSLGPREFFDACRLTRRTCLFTFINEADCCPVAEAIFQQIHEKHWIDGKCSAWTVAEMYTQDVQRYLKDLICRRSFNDSISKRPRNILKPRFRKVFQRIPSTARWREKLMAISKLKICSFNRSWFILYSNLTEFKAPNDDAVEQFDSGIFDILTKWESVDFNSFFELQFVFILLLYISTSFYPHLHVQSSL